MLHALLAAIAIVVSAPSASSAAEPDDLAPLVAELREKRDTAPAALVERICGVRTREAALAMRELYDVLVSAFMRRAVIRSLPVFDGVADAEQPALQLLMDIATADARESLRNEALEALARCESVGHAYLAMIVESEADLKVREKAMELHVVVPRAEDAPWYRLIYDVGLSGRTEVDGRALADGFQATPPIRGAAFDAVRGTFALDELLEACGDRQGTVRESALRELFGRGAPEAFEVAERVWVEARERVQNRTLAAEILLARGGVDAVPDIIEHTTRVGHLDSRTGGWVGGSEELRVGVAALLANLNDERVARKQLMPLLGKGSSALQTFALLALVTCESKTLDGKIRKLVRDKDTIVAHTAMEILARRADVEALPALLKEIDGAKVPDLAAQALSAAGRLAGDDPGWPATLLAEYVDHDEVLVRNEALRQLASLEDPRFRDVFVERLDAKHWSTRVMALRALVPIADAATIGILVGRLDLESGRLIRELVDVLWRLTGKPFGFRVASWKSWWAAEGANVEILTEEQFERLVETAEARQLREASSVAFFGLQIHSNRVVFLIDTSGSMKVPATGHDTHESVGSRMDIAKRELIKALDALARTSLTNIVTFDNRATPWLKRASEFHFAKLDNAKRFVGQLKADGATALWDALEYAFVDPDLDTLVILSDGEPTAGSIFDPAVIRQEVRRWNENRGVVIHCVAIGTTLDLLEHLARDSGGTYVKIS
jgi:Mg-chelatase subunit ChlD/HEAT repeat protein